MARRLSGAIQQPLSDGALVGVAVLSVVWAAAARLLGLYAVEPAAPPWKRPGIDWLPTVALALIGAAVSLPGSSAVAIVLLWTLIAAEEVAAGLLERGRTQSPAGRVAGNGSTAGRASGAAARVADRVESEDEFVAEHIWQHYTRERTDDGGEQIHGALRVVFARGERTTVEHLVFCPMLAEAPVVEAEPLGDVECTIRPTHVYRYGARLEIKRSEPYDEPAEVVLVFEVRSGSSASSR